MKNKIKKLLEKHKEIIVEIIESDNFLTVIKIADRMNCKISDENRNSQKTVWEFIRSKYIINKLPIQLHILTETQKSARKIFWVQNIDRNW